MPRYDRARDAIDQQRDQDRGKRQLHVGDAHDQRIELAADIPGDKTQADADDYREDDRGEADQQRNPRAEHDRGQQVATLIVGPEQVFRPRTGEATRRRQRVEQVQRRQIERIVRSDPRREQRSGEADKQHQR